MVFNCGVPNQRRPGQTFLGLQVSTELFKLVNEVRKKLRMDRSSFVREAIAEKLRALGYHVPSSMVDPPDRAERGEVEQPAASKALVTVVIDPPEQLRAAETPATPPLGPQKKVTYRKSKKT
jgi:hypothetical protein